MESKTLKNISKDQTTFSLDSAISEWTSGQLGSYWSGYWHNRKDWEEMIATVGIPNVRAFGDGASTKLNCTKLNVHVDISGMFSKTRFEMTFYNDSNATLAGELVFPLPEGAIVSGYGLDIDGEIVDGVVVEKQKARIAFEKEVRKGVDPGLIEKVQGNNFKTRVYPILPKNTRTVRVDYVSDLKPYVSKEGRDGIYTLPLEIPPNLQSFKMQVEVLKKNDKKPFTDARVGLNFSANKENTKWIASTVSTDLSSLKRGITIVIPSIFTDCSIVEKHKNGDDIYFFSICDFVNDETKVQGDGPKVKKIGILWDASYSREKADKILDYKCIEQVLKLCSANSEKFDVEVTVFRNKPEEPKLFSIKDGKADEIINFLKDVEYDGGTNLGASLPTKSENKIDFYLLFSDGLGNLCKDFPEKHLNAPIYGFCKELSANHNLLQYICEKSGGLYSNLSFEKLEDAVQHVGKEVFGFLYAEYDQDVIDDVFPSKFTALTTSNGRIIITGKLIGDKATITAHFGYGSKVTKTKKYEISKSNAVRSELSQLYWAQQKISELEIFATENKDEILSLGKEFSVVTSNSSLMVLETLQQHLEHKIPPAKSRKKMYKEYMDIMAQREKEQRQQESSKLQQIKSWWNERVKWWETDHLSKYNQDTKKRGSQFPLKKELISDILASKFVSADDAELMDDDGLDEWYEEEEAMEISAEEEKSIVKKDCAPLKAKKMSAPIKEEAKKMSAPKQPTQSQQASGTINVKAWDPKTPYLTSIKQQKSTQEAYKEYLKQRVQFGNSPAFYLDCAEYFFQKKEKDIAVRIITTIAELELENDQLFRTLAYTLEAHDEIELATFCYEKILHLRTEHPQPYRDLALIYAKQGKYEKALSLMYKVLVGKWEDRFSKMEDVVTMEMNHLISKLKKLAEKDKNFKMPKIPVDSDLIKPLDCDLRTVFVWDTDSTCIDLWVTEPNGTKCYYGNKRTPIGGFLSRDIMEGWGPNEYFIRKGLPGTYKISANYFSNYQQSLTGATIIFAHVWTNYGRENETCKAVISRITKQGETVPLGDITLK